MHKVGKINLESLVTVSSSALGLTDSIMDTIILGPNLQSITAVFPYIGSSYPKSHHLKNVVIKAKTPPTLSPASGSGKSLFLCYVDFTGGTIWVPAESLEAYKTHPTWGVWADHMKPIKWEDTEKW